MFVEAYDCLVAYEDLQTVAHAELSVASGDNCLGFSLDCHYRAYRRASRVLVGISLRGCCPNRLAPPQYVSHVDRREECDAASVTRGG